jgi:hypothetical protein
MLYRVVAHGLKQPGGCAALAPLVPPLARRKWRRFSPPLTFFFRLSLLCRSPVAVL